MRSSENFDKKDGKRLTDADERHLLKLVVDGDREAMTALYTLYFPRLFKFLYRFSLDYGLTEELVNDVMLIIWQSAARFRGSSQVSTWILGIGYRQCIKRLRKRHIPQATRQTNRDPPVDVRDALELHDGIAKALGQLPLEQRLMIEAVLYLGMTYREVAEMADCPVNTAKTRVHHARKKLKSILMAMGYGEAEKID